MLDLLINQLLGIYQLPYIMLLLTYSAIPSIFEKVLGTQTLFRIRSTDLPPASCVLLFFSFIISKVSPFYYGHNIIYDAMAGRKVVMAM